jgi:hypothetical protein
MSAAVRPARTPSTCGRGHGNIRPNAYASSADAARKPRESSRRPFWNGISRSRNDQPRGVLAVSVGRSDSGSRVESATQASSSQYGNFRAGLMSWMAKNRPATTSTATASTSQTGRVRGWT